MDSTTETASDEVSESATDTASPGAPEAATTEAKEASSTDTLSPEMSLPPDDVAAIDELGKVYAQFKAELGKVIIGQEDVIEKLAISLFARGHALLMGVPGLAKTLLVSSVADTFDLFGNMLLADEINRAPAKTQSAMLEAMQEHKVTVLGRNYVIEPPFFVLATQNPIEQEGTYPLPEAQLDRFMFLIPMRPKRSV